MPQFAKDALIQRMERSGLLDRLATDVRVLFRKRLRFQPNALRASQNLISTPLQVGAVSLGSLTLPASKKRERNVAYKHWLEMACNELANELNRPHSAGSHVLPAKIVRAIRLIKEAHTNRFLSEMSPKKSDSVASASADSFTKQSALPFPSISAKSA